jgi:NADPH-dependent ferric siderophore reductase
VGRTVPVTDGADPVAREGRPYGERLLEAVTSATLPDGLSYAWAAAESSLVGELRRHFRRAWGLPGDRVCAIGYWNRSAH